MMSRWYPFRLLLAIPFLVVNRRFWVGVYSIQATRVAGLIVTLGCLVYLFIALPTDVTIEPSDTIVEQNVSVGKISSKVIVGAESEGNAMFYNNVIRADVSELNIQRLIDYQLWCDDSNCELKAIIK
jgi:hypothetical protein